MNQPLAYVHPGAKIARNVVIDPFTTIHNNVVIGEGTWIGFDKADQSPSPGSTRLPMSLSRAS